MEQQRRRKLDYEIIVSNASHPGKFSRNYRREHKVFCVKDKINNHEALQHETFT